MELDHVSFTSAVSTYGYEQNLGLGKQMYGVTIKSGYGRHVSICNVLISTYSKCEDNEDAKLKAERFMKLISQVPGQLGFSLLQSLLGACKIHENVEMGERVSGALMGLEPTESDAYVQMSN
ncbi:unnamed protein product [Malus baccata var. baccata]